LTAGTGDGIVIGGSTTYDANVSALAGLLAEWSQQGLTYTQRVQAMAAGGTSALLLTPQTVTPDQPGNKLSGGAGSDWFWLAFNATAADKLGGAGAGEIVTLD
jgi:hypothetical protein